MNFVLIVLNHNNYQEVLANQFEAAKMWEGTHNFRLKIFTNDWPLLSLDEYDKAIKEGGQYEGDNKRLKQYWSDKHTEWAAKSIILDLAAAKGSNIGLSAEECITRYGQAKFITAYDYYNLYEFHNNNGIIIKIYIEIQTKKSFWVTYIDKKKPDGTLIPLGDKYGHCHYTKGSLYFLSIWVNSKLGILVLNQAN